MCCLTVLGHSNDTKYIIWFHSTVPKKYVAPSISGKSQIFKSFIFWIVIHFSSCYQWFSLIWQSCCYVNYIRRYSTFICYLSIDAHSKTLTWLELDMSIIKIHWNDLNLARDFWLLIRGIQTVPQKFWPGYQSEFCRTATNCHTWAREVIQWEPLLRHHFHDTTMAP